MCETEEERSHLHTENERLRKMVKLSSSLLDDYILGHRPFADDPRWIALDKLREADHG